MQSCKFILRPPPISVNRGLFFGHPYLVSHSTRFQSSATMTDVADAPKGRGALILFEGLDHSGKTTQAKRLTDALNQLNMPAELWRFPDRLTPLGKIISSYLSGETDCQPDMIHLLFAANRMEKRASLLQKLTSGVTVVMDRYCYSGAAFTMAKRIPGLSMEWCKDIEKGKMPKPDHTYVLDLPVEIAETRAGFGTERYEQKEIQEQVRRAFYELSKSENWEFVDATADPDEIHSKKWILFGAHVMDKAQPSLPVGQANKRQFFSYFRVLTAIAYGLYY